MIHGAHGEGVVEGLYQEPPAPYVTVYPGGPTTPGGTNGMPGPCTVYGEVFDKGLRKFHGYRTDFAVVSNGISTCMGVQLNGRGVGDPRESAELIFERMKAGMKVPYLLSHHDGPFPLGEVPGCMYVAVVMVQPWPVGARQTYKKFGSNLKPGYPDTCNGHGVPKPVTCSIIGQGDIVHQTATAGTVYRRNKITLGVECDGTASVVLDVPRNPAVLRTEDKQIESGIYINSDGVHSATVTADPHGSVDVISVVDTDVKFAGTYKGSVVLTATWD